jgi:hypothetical protein
MISKIFSIDPVDYWPVVFTGNKNGRLEDPIQIRSAGKQYLPDIFNRLPGLFFDPSGYQLTGLGIQRKLTRYEDKAQVFDGLAIVTSRLGG